MLRLSGAVSIRFTQTLSQNAPMHTHAAECWGAVCAGYVAPGDKYKEEGTITLLVVSELVRSCLAHC